MALESEAQKAQVRRTADFHPSIWGDYFITHKCNDKMVTTWSEQVGVLKEEMKCVLKAATNKTIQKWEMIDAIQRLGVSYHFEEEIAEALKQIYSSSLDNNDDEDLSATALKFRLLRQQGYNLSSDIFNKFKDGEGNFRENLTSDVQGMISLYEASYLSVQGEDILDEALSFTRNHLQCIVTQLSSPLANQMSHALKWPTRRGLPRKEASQYLSMYQQKEGHIEALLKLAKLDFNIVQKFHQKDLSIITKWWIDLDFTTKLPFARDRVIECSFWALGVFAEPQFSFGRRILAKAVAVLSVMDDIYDVHGTIEELELFTKVVESWDIGRKDELPDYMKLYFQALLDFYAEIEEETTKEGRPFCIQYVKQATKKQVRAYITEARWFNNDYVPTLEEYLDVSIVSSTYPILITISLCAMGEIASKEIFDWLFTYPKILQVASGLARIIDDIMSHEFEQERGHVASTVECYMKEHGISKQKAHSELMKVVENMWKDLNEELLKLSNNVPMPILTSILNIVRVMDVVYKDGDSYTNSKTAMKDILDALLVDPVVISA